MMKYSGSDCRDEDASVHLSDVVSDEASSAVPIRIILIGPVGALQSNVNSVHSERAERHRTIRTFPDDRCRASLCH